MHAREVNTSLLTTVTCLRADADRAQVTPTAMLARVGDGSLLNN